MKHREECIELARQGLTYEAIAEGVGIGRSTLDDWRQRYDEFRDELRRAQKEVEIECAECSATMHLPPGREINTKYCSECKAPSVKVECDQCGIEFQCSDYRMRRNEHNYCSPGCHKEWISENRVGENHPDYKGDCDRIPSGPRWKSQRSKALRRDGHECQSCGLSREEHYTEYGIDLHVHHIRPRRTFDDLEKANRVKNLVTLCVPCHGVYEGAFLSPVHRPAGD